MSSNILENYYDPLLQQNNFIPVKCPEKFSPAGSCWKIAQSVGEGYYWIYGRQDLFDINTTFTFTRISALTLRYLRASTFSVSTPYPAKS